MNKIKGNKRMLFLAGILIVLIIALVLILSFCGKNTSGKPIDDNVTQGEVSEDGLEILDPEDMENNSSEEEYEFVGPDGTAQSDKNSEDEKEKNESSDVDEDKDDSENDVQTNDKESDDKNENEKEEGNLSQETPEGNNENYGEFF